MGEAVSVKKRNGESEKFDVEKINKVLKWAVEGIEGVSISDIEMSAKTNLRDDITTSEIHASIIEAAVNLISLNTPNYQYVASRLVTYKLRKEVWGGKTPPRLLDFIKNCISQDLYGDSILIKYTLEEINKIGEWIDHDRDFIFTYAGITQMCDKYLIKNRISNKLFETPQFAYMAIAMVGFQNYGKNRLEYVRRAYNYFSKHKINLPTPVMAGMRTPVLSFASCCLVDVDDTMDSIFASVSAIGHATSKRYGIGINMGRMRAINTPIRQGETVHTGVIPFLKVFESTAKSCQQGGLRGGGGTVNFPIWHFEIEDILQLKNNGGTDTNRVRHLDYSIAISKIFYDRLLGGGSITLFSPHEVRDLYDAFGHPEFDKLYEKYEKNKAIKFKKTVSALELFSLLCTERIETGRIYINHVDHVNEHGSWLEDVKTLNLCQEVSHPLIPLRSLDDKDAEIGVCILSAINMLEVANETELQKACDLIVRFLDETIDIQEYFAPAAKNFATKRRSLGIGLTNYAAWLVKNDSDFCDKSAINLTDAFMESFQWYLLDASNQLAQEKGHCEKFLTTKYAIGILPIDTYKKDVDGICSRKLTMDWEELRERIKKYGLRNSTMSAQMPCESSSVIQCSTNGIEPPRDFITQKRSKAGSIPVLLPLIHKRQNYSLAFSFSNEYLIKLAAVMQKYTDMCQSFNLYYDYSQHPEGHIPISLLIKEQMLCYKYGIKAIYYTNSKGEKDDTAGEQESDCAGGACKI